MLDLAPYFRRPARWLQPRVVIIEQRGGGAHARALGSWLSTAGRLPER